MAELLTPLPPVASPHAPSPLYPVPRTGDPSLSSATRVWYLGLLLFVLHLALVAAIQWMVYSQFLGRSIVDVQQPLTDAFVRHGRRAILIELLLMGAVRLAIVGLRRLHPMLVDVRMLAAAALLSYAPIVLFGAGVLIAFTMGLELDVWILAASEASDREIASTIREALPVVLQPLTIGRQIANIGSAVLFAWLQYRLCRITPGRALLHAALAGAIVVAGYAYAWSA